MALFLFALIHPGKLPVISIPIDAILIPPEKRKSISTTFTIFRMYAGE